MAFPLRTDLPPMEAASVDAIPLGDAWQYEPKWDGFRCLAFRDDGEVELRSKAGQPLARYFPEIVQALAALRPKRFVLDGELVVPSGEGLDFDALLQRIHPAASRVKKLAAETPARLVVFDLLADERGASLVERPLRERRAALERFAQKNFPTGADARVRLSPATTELKLARKWFGAVGASLDGLIAKRRDASYAAGERTAMVKIKPLRTADCVVGGFRYAEKKKEVGSLLLGLYDADGKLHHVGFCSGLKAAEKPALTRKLEALVGGPGFTGRAPGGPSRWSTKRSSEWQPLEPKLVVEVSFDHVTAGRFRHGTSLLRWRPDKAPRQCTLEQLHQKTSRALAWLR
ncbi:ATP-dependent DNA ligase [Opitutus terrae]|uniref:DNA ligase (ATP) n=1 Tax=Opitutus terrae (strain DSM 11246 / JCM 15787 / PB90-1) TaxID=452637 RepID=B2A077_OPITP|nr:ATP-dependent DNA ligase [Opitutus terrae]ACB77413.1 ATP dependent DNA ligase [Opitutus terrae PB90-1]